LVCGWSGIWGGGCPLGQADYRTVVREFLRLRKVLYGCETTPAFRPAPDALTLHKRIENRYSERWRTSRKRNLCCDCLRGLSAPIGGSRPNHLPANRIFRRNENVAVTAPTVGHRDLLRRVFRSRCGVASELRRGEPLGPPLRDHPKKKISFYFRTSFAMRRNQAAGADR
jgi:hypothetical protein